MNRISQDGYHRITKKSARELFEAGKTIYLQRCNFWPVNPWSKCMPLNKETSDSTFDENVNGFEYYNCTDTQTGRYAAYYIKD